jgi:hypothetical protein
MGEKHVRDEYRIHGELMGLCIIIVHMVCALNTNDAW